MARGDIAKNRVIDKIKAAFGEDYVGVVDKKVYVWAQDSGEKVQIALTLTATKNPVSVGDNVIKTGDLDFGGGMDFEAMGTGEVVQSKAAEITEDEKANIAALMARLGL